jgi:hypothetical protein
VTYSRHFLYLSTLFKFHVEGIRASESLKFIRILYFPLGYVYFVLVLSVNVLSLVFTVLPYVKCVPIAVEMKVVHICKLILVYGTGVVGLN